MFLGLAPLKDHTNIKFIRIYLKHLNGYDKILTPFFLDAPRIGISKKDIEELNSLREYQDIIEPQILASSGKEMLKQALCLQEAGWNKININLGCPYKVVTNKYKGSQLLKHPDKLISNLNKLVNDGISISIKMRLGYDNIQDGIDTIDMLNNYPIRFNIIHARYAKDFYSGEVNIDDFNKLVNISRSETYYNGDITSQESFNKISQSVKNCSGFFIGRSALEELYLPNIIRNEVITGKYEGLKKIYNEIYLENYDKPKGLNFLKGFWHFFRKWLNLTNEQFHKVMRTNDPIKHIELINSYFDTYIEKNEIKEKNIYK